MIVAIGLFIRRKFSASQSKSSLLIFVAILGWIAIPIILGAAVLIGSRSAPKPEPHGRTPDNDVRLDIPSPQTSDLRTLSCSTSNCHGALAANPQESAIRSDEYFVWLNDPHAQAFRALSGERSRTIFQRLGVTDVQSKPLPGQADNFHRHWTNCLACHETSHQMATTSATAGHSVMRGEGVSCESCHGPARDWLHLHYQPEWKESVSEGRKRELGFVSGHDLPAQVKQCADCHVGSSSGGEVDHSLIAAGHPALRFEYVWYLSRLPKHWKPGRREAHARQTAQAIDPPPPASDENSMREWLIGQLVTTIASMEQLERRVARGGPHAPEPEFAEYNCFACHHSLRGMSWRRDRGIPGLASVGERRSRLTVSWGNWNLDLIPILADQHGSPHSREFSAAFSRLREALQASPAPAKSELLSHSETARRHAQGWLTEVARLSNRDAGEILQQVGLRQPEQLISSWDQTANILLGFAAPYHASEATPEALRVAMNRVRFPYDPTIIDSPAQFRSTEGEPTFTAAEWVDLLRKLANLRAEH